MPRYRRKPTEKQQESVPAYERTDKLETRENYRNFLSIECACIYAAPTNFFKILILSTYTE